MSNFCVLPFNSVSISGTGELRQCCNAGHLGSPLYVQNMTVEEMINSEYIQDIRQNLLDDVREPSCSRCWEMEDMGNKSFRHNSNENPVYGLDTPIAKQKQIQFSDVSYIDITLGNKCNLACRMCHPGSSSLLAKNLMEMEGKIITSSNDGLYDFDRATRDKILDLFYKCDNLRQVYFLGGEPLINDFHDEIIELLISKNRNRDISIHYSTNLQIDIEKFFPTWEKFKMIDLNVSIDGSDEVYEYIRWPGKWKKLYSNLEKACAFSKESNLHPTVATTVQNLNAHNLPDLIEKISYVNNTLIGYFFIPVTGGNDLYMCPPYILDQAISRFKEMPDTWSRLGDLVNLYENHKNRYTGLNKQEVEYFFAKQKAFDKHRKQNLFETASHFTELADDFGIETW